ncbi:MAG: helix-turn-helix domain-containing protein [Caldilineaceae bacterium]
MSTSTSGSSLPSFGSFGEMLRYLRRRARLTQRELSIAVGYSESMISRLEHNERPPDVATLLAVFVPPLDLAGEPETVARLTALAQAARDERPAESKQIEAPAVGNSQRFHAALDRLPQRLTSFIGRETEIGALTRLLTQARLVTLIGPGGCGKTSLAIEIVRALGGIGRRGVWHGNRRSPSQNLPTRCLPGRIPATN